MGEVPFNQIAADAKRIVPLADIPPGFTAKEMNGSKNLFAKPEIESTEQRLAVVRKDIQVNPSPMTSKTTSQTQGPPKLVIDISRTGQWFVPTGIGGNFYPPDTEWFP